MLYFTLLPAGSKLADLFCIYFHKQIANAGMLVTVAIQGKIAKGTSNSNGEWQINIGKFALSFAEEMMITAREETLILHDVHIG